MLDSSAAKLQISSSYAVNSAPHVIVQDMIDESALLNLKTDTYLSQNGTATQMFYTITESDSIAAAYDALLSRYNVEPDRLERDLLNLIQQWLEHELVELHLKTPEASENPSD